MSVPRDIKKTAERIAQLIFHNHEYLNAVDLIANELAAERDRTMERANRPSNKKP
jgi:hypothetical protein